MATLGGDVHMARKESKLLRESGKSKSFGELLLAVMPLQRVTTAGPRTGVWARSECFAHTKS
jgi:hypothetical protein